MALLGRGERPVKKDVGRWLCSKRESGGQHKWDAWVVREDGKVCRCCLYRVQGLPAGVNVPKELE